MENVLQLVLAAAGVVIAITLIVALSHLSAIRRLLGAMVEQGQAPARQPRFEAPPRDVEPASRPVVVSPPPPVQQLRYEEPEPVSPATRLGEMSPPPPEPLQHTPLGEAPEQFVLEEGAAESAQPAEAATAQPVPAARPAPSPPPPGPEQPKTSHMATIVGIIVLAFAVAFLVFMIFHTK